MISRPPLRPTRLLFLAGLLFGLIGAFSAVRSGMGALPYGLAALVLAGLGLSSRAEERGFDAALRARLREMRELEARIEEQGRTVDAVADGLDAALLMCDGGGRVRYANPPAHTLFGQGSPVGQTLLAATLSVELEELMIQAAEEDDAQRAEIAFAHPQEWIGLASAWRDPGADRTFVSVYEITELRRLERTRKDFVANVSHELRTPMTIIRGFAETLLDEDPPTVETANRMLPRIIAEVDRLSTIVQDLLVLSVAESNAVRKGDCDLAEVAQGVVSQLEAKAREKGLALDYDGPESLSIQANPAQIGQVMLNLMDNALNYTTEGAVTVRLSHEADQAVLRVRDTGLGIATEHQERVFERFYRVDRGRSRATGGTGLGLSIVRHIVEAHGGTVTLESALNRGSTFTVSLPVA